MARSGSLSQIAAGARRGRVASTYCGGCSPSAQSRSLRTRSPIGPACFGSNSPPNRRGQPRAPASTLGSTALPSTARSLMRTGTCSPAALLRLAAPPPCLASQPARALGSGYPAIHSGRAPVKRPAGGRCPQTPAIRANQSGHATRVGRSIASPSADGQEACSRSGPVPRAPRTPLGARQPARPPATETFDVPLNPTS